MTQIQFRNYLKAISLIDTFIASLFAWHGTLQTNISICVCISGFIHFLFKLLNIFFLIFSAHTRCFPPRSLSTILLYPIVCNNTLHADIAIVMVNPISTDFLIYCPSLLLPLFQCVNILL